MRSSGGALVEAGAGADGGFEEVGTGGMEGTLLSAAFQILKRSPERPNLNEITGVKLWFTGGISCSYLFVAVSILKA